MKVTLAFLSLSTSTLLFANKCMDPCCRPCCIPQPRVPICCEAYTPAVYDMQCAWGVDISFDFLYWYAGESNLPFANVATTTSRATVSRPATATTPTSYKYLSTKWQPGGRFGLGWNSDCDGWDLHTNWTYYKGKAHGSASVTPFSSEVPSVGQKGILPIWVDNSVFDKSAPQGFALFNSISGSWKFTLNQIDLEMGRRYYLSPCFTMRPYAGLRGAWTRTSFSTKGGSTYNVTTAPTLPTTNGFHSVHTKDSFRNRNWGVGFLAGFQPAFYFTEGFSLYANADAALLWGNFHNKTKRHYTSTINSTIADIDFQYATTGSFSGMQPILDLGLGIRWETYWCEKRYGLELDVGWEHHVWFAHNQRTRLLENASIFASPAASALDGASTSAFPINSEDSCNDVALGGLLVGIRFSF